MLGLLGALDPWIHKVHLGQIDNKGEAGAVLSQGDTKKGADGSQLGKRMALNDFQHRRTKQYVNL